jgi:Flp pilus assembly protein TadD
MKQWREDFARDPNQAVADLFSGRAGLGANMRLDTPELLYQAFPDTPEYAEQRKQLDNALLYWLTTMRRDYAAQVKRLGYGVYSKRLCDALTSIQLLDLPLSIYHLRETASSWLNWLTPLRLAPERDPALEYWRVLTHRQGEQADPAPWLQLANDPRLEYLSVALVGLQRLPISTNAQRNQQTQLLALLRHAVLLPDSGQAFAFFTQQYAALRATYPAAPEHWRNLLGTVVKGFKAQSTFAKEVLAKITQHTNAQPQRGATRTLTLQPADQTEFNNLVKDIKKSQHSAESLAQRLFTLLDKNYAYSQATGDSFYFIRTLSKQGSLLLKRHKLIDTSMNSLQLMIERGLSLQPMNSSMWMIWAKWLECSGHQDAEEWVLRETIRLFPSSAPRIVLGKMLIHRKKYKEAEYWLKEAFALNPNDNRPRIVLATLFERQGKYEDAKRWLLEAVEYNPDDEPPRVKLALLLMRQGERDEAKYQLLEAAKRNPRHMPCREVLAQLLIGQGEYLEAERWLLEVIEYSRNDESSRVALANIWVKHSKVTEAENLLVELLNRRPQCDHARKVLTRIQNGSIDLSTGIDFDIDDNDDLLLNPISNISEQYLQARDDNQKKLHTNNDSPNPTTANSENLSEILNELQRRAQLQTEFSQAQKLSVVNSDYIANEAEKGNALACFYQQWLQPDEALSSPPHAWAAHACRLYQTHASDWQQLDQTFPEHLLENRFLRVQMTNDTTEADRLLKKLSSEAAESLTPLQQFMCQVLKTGRPPNNDNIVLTVLANAAVNAPQLVM